MQSEDQKKGNYISITKARQKEIKNLTLLEPQLADGDGRGGGGHRQLGAPPYGRPPGAPRPSSTADARGWTRLPERPPLVPICRRHGRPCPPARPLNSRNPSACATAVLWSGRSGCRVAEQESGAARWLAEAGRLAVVQ
jgi:hypothetical protein